MKKKIIFFYIKKNLFFLNKFRKEFNDVPKKR